MVKVVGINSSNNHNFQHCGIFIPNSMHIGLYSRIIYTALLMKSTRPQLLWWWLHYIIKMESASSARTIRVDTQLTNHWKHKPKNILEYTKRCIVAPVHFILLRPRHLCFKYVGNLI